MENELVNIAPIDSVLPNSHLLRLPLEYGSAANAQQHLIEADDSARTNVS